MKITTPDSWDEVTISKFQEINSIQDSSLRSLEIVSILIDQDIEDIRKYDMQSLNRIVDALKWCDELPNEKEFTKTLEVKGITYNMVRMSSFSVGEWSDLEEYFEDSINNLHKILAVFYRENSLPYNTETAEQRAELFKEHVTVGQTYGAVVFFCNIEKSCMRTIAVYFHLQTLLMKSQKPNQKKRFGWLKMLRLKNGDGTHTPTA